MTLVPDGARADRRQRADPHEHRSLVQRADGRDPVVGQPDRERLLPRAADAGERSREPPRADAGRRRSGERRRAADPRSAGARRHAAARADGRGLPRRAVGRLAAQPGAGGRRRRAVAAAPATAAPRPIGSRRRRSPGRRDARSIETLGAAGDLLHAAAVIRDEGRQAVGRRRRDRLPDRRSRGARRAA